MERTFACSSSASNARPRDKLPRGRAKSPRRPATALGRSLNRIVEASGSTGDTPSARKGGNRNVDDVKVKARSGHVGQPWVGVADRKGVALGLAHPALVRVLCRKGKGRIVRTGATVCELRCPHAVESFARHWKRIRSVVVGVDPGAKVTGIAVVADGEMVWSAEIQHRGAMIRKHLEQRRGARSARRCRRERKAMRAAKPARWKFRTRPVGWIPPSLRHRVQSALWWVRWVVRFAGAGGADRALRGRGESVRRRGAQEAASYDAQDEVLAAA